MGALSGSISFRRYRVMGTPPRDFRDTFTNGVRAHALIPLNPKKNPHEEKSIGWCSLHDQDDLELDFTKFWFDGRILLSLRVDVIKPSAGEVKRALAQRVREEEEKRKTKIPKTALRELKDIIVAELRLRTPPKIKTTDMVWNVDQQKLYFFSQSKGPNETFLELFVQSFGMAIDTEGPGSWAQEMAEEQKMEGLLKKAMPTAALLGGFEGLRPGTRPVDELDQVAGR